MLDTESVGTGPAPSWPPLQDGGADRPRPRSRDLVSQETAAVVVQQPNFFGGLEDLERAAAIAHDAGALLIVVADPISLGLLKPPGACGADIVVGEGQAFGNPLSFGGPDLGFMAVTKPLMRRLPGRLVGRDPRPRGQARLRPHAADARAAHPPREGDQQHLLQPRPLRPGRRWST